jgi:hypothetical protein
MLGAFNVPLQFDSLNKELLPRLEEAKQGRCCVFFAYSAHFALGAFLCMIWSVTRILVPSGSGRQRYSVLSAIVTRDVDLVGVTTSGSINNEFVRGLRGNSVPRSPGEKITLVTDSVRYQPG